MKELKCKMASLPDIEDIGDPESDECPQLREDGCARYIVSNAKALTAQIVDYWTVGDVWQCIQPPGTLFAATKLTGTKQWPAEFGYYGVATMNTMDNPATYQQPCLVACAYQDAGGNGQITGNFQTTGTIVGPATTTLALPAKGNLGASAAPTQALIVPNSKICPYNMIGAYFTGLSPQTTLEVNVVYYVERFPTPFESDLVVLASPSAGYDPVALEIYSRAMAGLPVGVMQNENPLGEWFGDILDKVARVAAPIGRALSMVPGPVGVAGSVIGSAADTYRGLRQPARREKKAQRKAARGAQPASNKNKPRIIPGPGRTN